MFFLTLLLTIIPFSLSHPFPPLLQPRNPLFPTTCSNAPFHPAGAYLPRSLPLLSSRVTGDVPVTWCAHNSLVFVQIFPTAVVAGSAASSLLQAAMEKIAESVPAAPITDGFFEAMGSAPENLLLHVWNAGDGGITNEVLGLTVQALRDYMGRGVCVAARFYVYVAGTEVGMGLIS